MKIKRLIMLFCITMTLAGCTSFGRGVAEAILERKQAKDTRVCQIRGETFDGLMPHLENNKGATKVLMVHGVGDHQPGYATQLMESLGNKLDLNFIGKKTKNLSLTNPLDTTKKLGNLRINQLLNEDRSKELLFYELTWSEITADEKKVLAYDNSGEYSFRRADINNAMKKFSNDTGPDPMIYLGSSREEILVSFGQSFCWMVTSDWDELPLKTDQPCLPYSETAIENIKTDHYALISHSLGSRITIDGMQRMAALFGGELAQYKGKIKKPEALIEAFKNIQIPIYMLSNQLPMLQLGRELPEVTGQKEAYCSTDGEHYASRMVSETSIIAFSDPNDMLSYAIPSGFAEEYLDSRLCIDITNININVANVIDAFGLGTFANPMAAHIGYDTDERVIALIAKGVGNLDTAPIIKERCTSLVTVE